MGHKETKLKIAALLDIFNTEKKTETRGLCERLSLCQVEKRDELFEVQAKLNGAYRMLADQLRDLNQKHWRITRAIELGYMTSDIVRYAWEMRLRE